MPQSGAGLLSPWKSEASEHPSWRPSWGGGIRDEQRSGLMARECVEAAAVVQASREQRTQHSDSDVGEEGGECTGG